MVRLKLSTKIFICSTLLIWAYSEWMVYQLLPFGWRSPPVCSPPKCHRLLLVADPQIVGAQSTPFGWVVSWLAVGDCDRYLLRTFLKALDHVEPNIVVFLGDIMDEGHRSSDEDFQVDLRRFESIFRLPEVHRDAQIIILPGDNDIGGEDGIMLPEFERVFDQSEGPVMLGAIELYKVNSLTYTMQEPVGTVDVEDDSVMRVALGHIPLLPRASPFVQTVMKKIQPHVIFSGHRHMSLHVVSSRGNIYKRTIAGIGPNETEAKVFTLGKGLLHEVVVPTCSYRMGVMNMGYGTAYIDTENKLLFYDVLWLPSRFVHLILYLLALCAVTIAMCFSTCVWLSCRLRRVLRRVHSKMVASRPFLP